jgi:Bacterial dipeptidyl-peptidase Sh3 domain
MCSSCAPMTGPISLKALSASSVPTTAVPLVRPSGASTSASLPSPIVDGFALTGVSVFPDPTTHAYRKDLADAALAGQVIASHYAEPLVRHILCDAPVYAAASLEAEVIAQVAKGEVLRMLDCARGWAWGYIADGRVAYVRSSAVRV